MNSSNAVGFKATSFASPQRGSIQSVHSRSFAVALVDKRNRPGSFFADAAASKATAVSLPMSGEQLSSRSRAVATSMNKFRIFIVGTTLDVSCRLGTSSPDSPRERFREQTESQMDLWSWSAFHGQRPSPKTRPVTSFHIAACALISLNLRVTSKAPESRTSIPLFRQNARYTAQAPRHVWVPCQNSSDYRSGIADILVLVCQMR